MPTDITMKIGGAVGQGIQTVGAVVAQAGHRTAHLHRRGRPALCHPCLPGRISPVRLRLAHHRRRHGDADAAPGGDQRCVQPLAVALALGCGFVARGFSGERERLSGLIQAGIVHRGFSLIGIFFQKEKPTFMDKVPGLQGPSLVDRRYDPGRLQAVLDAL